MKYLISFIALSLTNLTLANDLDPYWFHHPEDGERKQDFVGASEFRDKMLAIVGSQKSALEQIQMNSSIGRWYLDGVNTSIGLSLSGNIGLLTWGGRKTIELFWHRKSMNKQEEIVSKSIQTIRIDESFSDRDLQNKIDSIVQTLASTGKVKKSKHLRENLLIESRKFVRTTQAAMVATDFGWKVKKLRLDLSIGASGKVASVFTSVGGDLRLRLEWSKSTPSNYVVSDARLTYEQTKVKDFIENMSKQLSVAKLLELTDKKFELNYVRIGMSIVNKTSVGVAKGEVGFATFVYLTPSYSVDTFFDNTLTLDPSNGFSLLIAKPEKKHLRFAMKRGYRYRAVGRSTEFYVSSSKLRRGMRKAVSYATKAARIISERDLGGRWGVKKIRSSYSFSLTGDIGTVSVKGTPSIELEFKNRNF